MTDSVKGSGRGNFPAVPFTFTYTYDPSGEHYEVTWQGRGRKPKQYEIQVFREKEELGHSPTEEACKNRNPRWQAKAEQDELLRKARAAAKAERQAKVDARRARQAERMQRYSDEATAQRQNGA